MILRLDPGSPLPPYEQLREQVTALVLTGQLPEATRLPPIRQLASDLGLAPGTVARAYRELEGDGIVISRGRKGTFTRTPPPPPPGEQHHHLTEAARTFALRAKQLGVNTNEALEHARAALEELTHAQHT